jgi:hypothetical protein
MLAIRLDLSGDGKTMQLQLSPASYPETMTAEDLTYLIRHLEWARASMESSASPADPVQRMMASSIPVTQWKAVEDDVPGQCRLYLLHPVPGFGWFHIHLDRLAFDHMSKKLRRLTHDVDDLPLSAASHPFANVSGQAVVESVTG